MALSQDDSSVNIVTCIIIIVVVVVNFFPFLSQKLKQNVFINPPVMFIFILDHILVQRKERSNIVGGGFPR